MSYYQTWSLTPKRLCVPPPIEKVTTFLGEVLRRGHVSTDAVPFGIARYGGAPVHLSSHSYEQLALDASRGESHGGVRRTRNRVWHHGIHDVHLHGDLRSVAAMLDTPDYTLALQSERSPLLPTSREVLAPGGVPVEEQYYVHVVCVTIASQPFSIDPREDAAIGWGRPVGDQIALVSDVPVHDAYTGAVLERIPLAAATWAVSVTYAKNAVAEEGLSEPFRALAQDHFGLPLRQTSLTR